MDKKTQTLSKLVSELRHSHADENLIEKAVEIIESYQKELKRPLEEHEATVVLANSGFFPEMSNKLENEAFRTGAMQKQYGQELRQPAKTKVGNLISKSLIEAQRRTSEGD